MTHETYEYEAGKMAWKKYRRLIDGMDTDVQSLLHWFGAEMFENGYASAVRDAVNAVNALPDTGGWTTPDRVIHEIDRAQAVDAIDALCGER